MSLRVTTYSRGRKFYTLTHCPFCGYNFDPEESRQIQWVKRSRVYETSMRIRTDGDYAHRKDTIGSAMDALNEIAKTAAVLAACEHARWDRKAKQEALAHPDMTSELAEVLSAPIMQLIYETETGVETE